MTAPVFEHTERLRRTIAVRHFWLVCGANEISLAVLPITVNAMIAARVRTPSPILRRRFICHHMTSPEKDHTMSDNAVQSAKSAHQKVAPTRSG